MTWSVAGARRSRQPSSIRIAERAPESTGTLTAYSHFFHLKNRYGSTAASTISSIANG